MSSGAVIRFDVLRLIWQVSMVVFHDHADGVCKFGVFDTEEVQADYAVVGLASWEHKPD